MRRRRRRKVDLDVWVAVIAFFVGMSIVIWHDSMGTWLRYAWEHRARF